MSVKTYYRPDAAEGNPAAKYHPSIEAIAVDRLHAKVYANEKVALITSMNLHRFSALNARETGLLIRDEQVLREIENWVSALSQDIPYNIVPGSEGRQVTAVPMHTGYCIGCKVNPKVIEFDPEKPFCSSAGHDFSTATGFRCHKCGELSETNRESPLCPLHP